MQTVKWNISERLCPAHILLVSQITLPKLFFRCQNQCLCSRKRIIFCTCAACFSYSKFPGWYFSEETFFIVFKELFCWEIRNSVQHCPHRSAAESKWILLPIPHKRKVEDIYPLINHVYIFTSNCQLDCTSWIQKETNFWAKKLTYLLPELSKIFIL